MNLNRRDFGKLALAVPAGQLLAAEPDSRFSGIQVGVITYSFRDMPNAHTDGEAMLKYITEANVSSIELMSDAAEAWVGSPTAAPAMAGNGGMMMAGPGGGGRGASGMARPQLTPEQIAARQAAQKEAATKLKDWRMSVSMDKYKAFRKMYNDAGVSIYAFKLEPQPTMGDDELEYIFTAAKTLGANQVTRELVTNNPDFTKRIGDMALKHGLVVAYHAHEQATIDAWDGVLGQSRGNAVNLDCGHYFAGTGLSPIPAIEKLHDRIASVHLKDRTPSKPGTPGQNLPWGQGDTPIAGILQTMRKNNYKFPASIELEYQVPQGSTSVIEVKKCVEFCRKALA
jgi:sugar phosphate isomerase/epimerase